MLLRLNIVGGRAMSKATPFYPYKYLGGPHPSYDNPILGISLARLYVKLGEGFGQSTLPVFWLISLAPPQTVPVAYL